MRSLVVTFALLLGPLSLAACATTRGRADDLLARRQYAEAVEVYDAQLAAHPEDAEARALREHARNRAVELLLVDAAALRQKGARGEWLDRLDRALTRVHGWGFTPERAVAASLDAELKALGEYARAGVGGLAGRGKPLAAEQLLRDLGKVLRHAEGRALHTELAAEVSRSGRKRCEELAAGVTPEEPYWAWAVDRYCQRFQGKLTLLPTPPHARSRLDVYGGVEGAEGTESTVLRAQLSAWFTKSVWYAAAAPLRAGGALEGRVAMTTSTRRIGVDRPWEERIHYTVPQTVMQPYQESYLDNEPYSVAVPYSDYVTESYPCGRTTCTRSRSVSRTRYETRTRLVTRTRTAYRPVTQMVPMTRTESRTFHFEADEVRSDYSGRIAVHVDPGGGYEPLAFHVERTTTRTALSHDVSFPPAGVEPQVARLPSLPEFFVEETARLEKEMQVALAAHYQRLFCGRASYTVDEAARCLYGGRRDPAAERALEAKVEDEAPQLAAQLRGELPAP